MTIFTKFWQNVTRNVINVKNIRAASLSCDKLREIHLIWVDTSRATLVHFKCYLFVWMLWFWQFLDVAQLNLL